MIKKTLIDRADGVQAALAAAAQEATRKEAISYYHDLMEKMDLTEYGESLMGELSDRKVLFGGRPLCPFLRPNFIGRPQLNLLAAAVRGVVGAINLLAPKIVESEYLQDFLGLTEQERMLAAVDPGYPQLSLSSRLDSFLIGGKVHFVEYNAESPAGIGYNDQMTSAFLNTEIMKRFRKRYPCMPFFTSDTLLRSLIASYRSYGGVDDPVIGIIDYQDIPTTYEFEILEEFFASRGFSCVTADPRELEYDGEKLHYKGQKIDLVYRRLLTNEFLEHFEDAQPLWEAYRDHNVCVVNNFRAKYLHKKAIFALITDPRFQDGMTHEQLYAIYSYVPWTRKVEETISTNPENKPIDLLKWISMNKEELVLKPNDEYGGKGIFVGWETEQAEWDKAIELALESYYLVQTRVDVARETYPAYVDKTVQFGEYTVDLDPFVFDGEVEGLLTRLSATALCNVTAGGGGVPTFILD